MASVEECSQALHTLAHQMSTAAAAKQITFDRTLSCRITDLAVVFGAHLHDGSLDNIRIVESPDAQIKLAMSSDDLLALVCGRLNLASAWASGRIKIDASVLDLLKLRSMF